MEFQRILIRATNWVGDAVMSVPAFQAMRRRFPKAHIAVLARPWVAGLYKREPFCDEVIPYSISKGWRGVRERLEVASQLRARRFDCAILFQNAFDAAAIARLARIPVRIGYRRDARGWLLTHAIAVPEAGEIPRHQRFYYLELLKRAKLIEDYPAESIIRFSVADGAAALGRMRFQIACLAAPVIGVSPGAAYGGAKRWLPERFVAAASEIAREMKGSIAVFGSEDEFAICEEVRRGIEADGLNCVNFAGKTSIAGLVELIASCEIFLTNDSGPMHIASALGVPTVAIFGATDDEATGPTGAHSVVVREQVECSPCLLRECPIDHRCMARVTADRVVRAALSLVEMRKAATQ